MAGRAHLYEGYSPAQVTFGVRVLDGSGVRRIVFTNAAGGINLSYARGAPGADLRSHQPAGLESARRPERRIARPALPRHVGSLLRALSRDRQASRQANSASRSTEGVYAALLGPSYETPAEIRYLRTIGADLVGMSTVPEVIVANHMGMRCSAISCVTNMAAGILPQKLNHEEVLETGAMVRDTLVRFLKALLPRLEV